MNHKFDELTKNLAQSMTRRGALKKFGVGIPALALAGLLTSSADAQVSALGPFLEISQPNPVGGCDDGFRLPGTWTINDAAEPYAVVNPNNPNNIVASWILGPAQNIICGVSRNGGRNWQQVSIPLSICSGGPYAGAGDPGLSFAPNGDLYAVNIAGMTLPERAIFVNKSSDGGLHWSAPILVPGTAGTMPDRPTITADRTDPRFAYAIWPSHTDKNQTPPAFARTTNGGLSWEPARAIFQPASHHYVDNNQIFVLGDGTLVAVCFAFYEPGSQPPKVQNLAILRSADKGQSWSAPTFGPAITPVFQPNGLNGVVDPETGLYLHDPGDPAFAQDTRSGNLYAVWEDARFSNFQYDDIAFSMSSDGGLTWSPPIRVNRTPLNIPPLNRQAFQPSIGVLGDGTIGVSYYDFRLNDANPGLPTDYWLVQCHPSASAPCTEPGNWGSEVRLTSNSFDLEKCMVFPEGEFFLGDYVGSLVGSGNSFVATFTAVDQSGVTAIFGRRVGQ